MFYLGTQIYYAAILFEKNVRIPNQTRCKISEFYFVLWKQNKNLFSSINN
jgi:hypothetical protein